MYRCPLSGLGNDLKAGHEALHDGKAHSAAFIAARCICRAPGLLHIRDAHPLVFDHNIQNGILEDSAPERDISQFFRIGVNNAICYRFRDRRTDISQFFQCGVHLSREAGHGRTGKGFICGFTGKVQDHIVVEFHDTASLISTNLSIPDARKTRMGWGAMPVSKS